MRLSILNKVEAYIERHRLIGKSDKCIVAISGGADSVALLLVMRELGYDVEAAHCNFHLRGEESNRDERFVEDLCKANGITLHRAHFDTHEYATLHKVSIEMAARDLRYAYFERLRRDINACNICVAHHREDSVETLLINLVRGTGLHGLTGIQPRNGHIVRPLLCVSRNEIEDYLAHKRQAFVTDSTNLVPDVMRNKIRLNIMPLLREINPNADVSIWRTAERLNEAAKVFDKATSKAIANVATTNNGRTTIDIEKLKSQPAPEYLLHEILKNYGFAPSAEEQIYANINAQSGRFFCSASHDLAIDRGRLIIERHRTATSTMKIPETGTYVVNETTKLKVSTETDFAISRSANVATLDASKVSFPLTVRETVAGDRFTPFGMKGSKLVSDYLTDKKKDIFEKRRQLVVCDSNGEIVWLVNERTSEKARIGKDCKRALVIALQTIALQ